MSIDLTPEEPYVHSYQLADRVKALTDSMKTAKASMEDNPAMAAAYVLMAERLMDLLGVLMPEYLRMGAVLERDPSLCTAVFLRCDQHTDPHHKDHYDYVNRTRWSRDAHGITMAREPW